MKHVHHFFVRLFIVSTAVFIAVVFVTRWSNSLSNHKVQAQFSDHGYIHMDPSGRGFIYDDGTKFIPNSAPNPNLVERGWIDDPVSGREYSLGLGAWGWSKGDCQGAADTPGYTYDQYFSELAGKGITGVRVDIPGGEGSAWKGPNHLSLEPIPVGYYYVYDKCLTGDDAAFRSRNGKDQIDGADFLKNYPNCRYPNFTDSFCGSTYGPKLRRSLLTRMLQAAEKHNIKIQLVLFATIDLYPSEHPEGWVHSAYNSINGGPIANSGEYFTDPEAKRLQKQRAGFVINTWGDSKAVWRWDVFNELEFAPGISSAEQSDKIAWVKDLTRYIKDIDTHHRPVSSSAYVDPNWLKYSSMNNRYSSSSHDFIDFHEYDYSLLSQLKTFIRDAEKTYGKTVLIGEFWPWDSDFTKTDKTGLLVESGQLTDPPSEDKPYRPSLTHLWTQLIGSGSSVTQRWGSRGLSGVSGMDTYTVAPLYSATAKFISRVNWANWNLNLSQPWEDQITASNNDFIIARGDGDQVMVFLHATNDSSSLSVKGLANGAYNIKVFDYISGNVVTATTTQADNNTLSFAMNLTNGFLDVPKDGYDRKRFGLVLLEKTSLSIPSPSPSPTPTTHNASPTTNQTSCPANPAKLTCFESWRSSFTGGIYSEDADMNSDGRVSLSDYETWRNAYIGG